MTDAPHISVVLTTYNRRHALPRAIESVVTQNGVTFELIVVDDASTDDTGSYLAGLNDPRIRVLRAGLNGGPSVARNRGLEASRAEFVAFLDSDDAYLAGRLAKPLAVLRENADCVCVLSSAVKHDKSGVRESRVPAVRLAAPAFGWALLCDLIPVEGTSITVRRDAAMSAGGFSPRLRLAEDREFLIRLARRGAGTLLPDLLWEKFWSDDSLSNDRAKVGPRMLAYLKETPDYATHHPALGSYLATKTLVADLRDQAWCAFWRDLTAFRAAGFVSCNPLRALRDHRAVRRYRRAHSGAQALHALTGPPSRL